MTDRATILDHIGDTPLLKLNHVEGVDLNLPFAHLLAHDLAQRLGHETLALSDASPTAYRREQPIDRTQRPSGALPWENETMTFYTLVMVQTCCVWWARQDSNLRPRDYESPALTN